MCSFHGEVYIYMCVCVCVCVCEFCERGHEFCERRYINVFCKGEPASSLQGYFNHLL